jgi:hypothetical protein
VLTSQSPTAWKQALGGVVHETPAQGFGLQRPVTPSQPNAQGASDCWKEQAPVPGVHVPPE